AAELAWFRWTPSAAEQKACDDAVELPEGADDDETAPPGQPARRTTSGWQNGLHDGNFEVLVDLWWGTNGSVLALYEDEELIATESLELDTPAAQSVRLPVTGRANGTYVYTAVLLNSQGGTESMPVTVTVSDA